MATRAAEYAASAGGMCRGLSQESAFQNQARLRGEPCLTVGLAHSSDLRGASICEQLDTVDEARGVGREEQRGLGDLPWVRDPSQLNRTREGIDEPLAVVRRNQPEESGRSCCARTQHIDADPTRPEFENP